MPVREATDGAMKLPERGGRWIRVAERIRWLAMNIGSIELEALAGHLLGF